MMRVNTMTANSHSLKLPGCTPEPLMAYLKALGIFRLVAEQKDPKSRACWQDDTFVLHSSLNREALLGFFLEEYRPTPIVSPWNGGSGFYSDGSRAAKEAVDSIRAEGPNRLEEYRQAIEASQKVLDYMGFDKKPSDREKPSLLAECRNWLPDAAVSWLDAVYVLTGADSELQPLLGSGGNDGNLDFSSNFMKNLRPVLSGLELGKKPSKRVDYEERRKGWLDSALFDDSHASLVKSAIGQFNPGRVGGPNATAGSVALCWVGLYYRGHEP
ncbi:type I-U CRISPR-associated protein Csx17, partial [Candidatus Saccharibacteria bacterium]|nr:type I-U CRISPR-associated protein Csx17 [Candidatus Saccharibacteria bacterium]